MEEKGGSNSADQEKSDQMHQESDRNEIYSEVYQGSLSSLRNETPNQNPYLNDPNSGNMVHEGSDLSRDRISPPLPASTPGSIPTVIAAQPKQPPAPIKFEKANTNCTIDYKNRDPENLQESIKIDFSDIIAEPSGTHSFNTIWGSSYKVFSLTKYWIYRVMTLILGVPCSLFWGIYFACLAFVGVWLVIPCIRAFSIKFVYLGKFWSLLIRNVLDPVFESVGLILSRIKIMMTHRRD